MFIVFEGPEGCGKSTQARLAGDALRQRGVGTVVTREPGGTSLGERLREILLKSTDRIDLRTEILLYMASRAQMVDEVIRPAIDDGKIVLCERFLSSTIVYQGMAGGGNLDAIETIGSFTTDGIEPNLTIVIDIDAETGLNRAGTPDRVESRGGNYHKKVREGFLTLARKKPERFALINGDQPVEDVHKQVMEAIDKKLQ